MAFQFVQPDAEDFELIEEDGESAVVAYVGHDPDTEASYFVSVALSPFGDDVEYSFTVVERKNDQERLFTSGLETKDIFGKVDRSAIRMVILDATEMVLTWKEPPLVDRCTSDGNLPAGAVVKHTLVGQIFKKCGYKVTECGDWNGQLVWRAERE
jgi:hypothetical protein